MLSPQVQVLAEHAGQEPFRYMFGICERDSREG